MGFRRELPAHGRGIHAQNVYSAAKLPAQGPGIHRRNGIPPGITSSFTPIQTGKIKMRVNPPNGNNSKISSYCHCQCFKKYKFENVIKMKNKPNPAL
jgi:hypothetical protein